MKKQIASTWMVASRALVGKLLVILAVMAAVQMGLFLVQLDEIRNLPQDSGTEMTFSSLLNRAGTDKLFFAALTAVTAICAMQGCRFSGKNIYTLQRLPLGELRTTILWSLVYLACYIILWAGQLAAVYGLWQMYVRTMGSGNPGLELFVAFYSSSFLHTLLPLAEVSRWLAMTGYGVTLAWSAACFGFFQRRGRIRAELLLLIGNPLWLCSSAGSAGNDYFCMVCYLVLWCTQCVGVWGVMNDEEAN